MQVLFAIFVLYNHLSPYNLRWCVRVAPRHVSPSHAHRLVKSTDWLRPPARHAHWPPSWPRPSPRNLDRQKTERWWWCGINFADRSFANPQRNHGLQRQRDVVPRLSRHFARVSRGLIPRVPWYTVQVPPGRGSTASSTVVRYYILQCVRQHLGMRGRGHR